MAIGIVALIMAASIVESEPVDLALVLPEKAAVEYRLEKSERTDGGPWQTSASRYRVEITPIDELSYETRWLNLDSPDDLPLVFRTDEALLPIRIVNHQETIDSMARMIEADHPGSKDNAPTLAMFRAMSAETLTGLLAKNFILTTMGQGTYLVPGEVNRYEQPGGTFGDGEPMIMNASFLLDAVKPDAGTAMVTWTNEIDPASARKALPGLIGDMLGMADVNEPDIEAKMAALMATAEFMKRTECRYQIDIPTGLATHSWCEEIQNIQVEGESRRRELKLTATQRLIR